MGLNMFGMIDSVFASVNAVSISTGDGSYVNGVWVPGTSTRTTFTVNMQPANEKELQFLNLGGERVHNVNKIYINDPRAQTVDLYCDWEVEGVHYKTIQIDNRPWRTYCKVYIERTDDQ